jgi:DNA-binding beta-propeller fold protein YncE
MGISPVRTSCRHFGGLARCFLFYAAVVISFITVLPARDVSAEIIAVNNIGGFKSPTRIATTESGKIYITDHKKSAVVILDDEGNKLNTLYGFKAPLGVAVHETAPVENCEKYKDKQNKEDKCKDPTVTEGQILLYVGDEGDGSVKIFKDSKKYGVLGSGRGEFIMPNAIAVTSDLTVFVVDSKANQIKKYDNTGTLQTTFGSESLNFPTDIALNELTGELYVTDFYNLRIRTYDFAGNWVRDIFAPNNDDGDPLFFRPVGLGIDTTGNLYVVDNALSCVVKISNLGIRLDTIGYANGEYWTGELSLPIDAAVTGNRIFVTSNKDQKIKVFEVTP